MLMYYVTLAFTFPDKAEYHLKRLSKILNRSIPLMSPNRKPRISVRHHARHTHTPYLHSSSVKSLHLQSQTLYLPAPPAKNLHLVSYPPTPSHVCTQALQSSAWNNRNIYPFVNNRIAMAGTTMINDTPIVISIPCGEYLSG